MLENICGGECPRGRAVAMVVGAFLCEALVLSTIEDRASNWARTANVDAVMHADAQGELT